MTTSEVDQILRTLNDMRVDAAERLARLETRLDELKGLPSEMREIEERVTALEFAIKAQGRFSWGDVFRFAGVTAAIVGAAFTVTHW